EDSKVWVSESKNFKNAKTFDVKPKKVKSKYLERDKHGHIIFKDIAKNDEGEPIKDRNGEEKVNGYYTDKHAGGPEWMSGDKHGKTNLISEAEYTYKAQAKDLKPNTKYYYKVGSEKGGKSQIGQVKTGGKNDEKKNKTNLRKKAEYTYKAQAKDLKPNTKYYYKVGSEKGGKSQIGQFKTGGKKGDPFNFVQYTDTQNAFWNEHVRNEATFGADTLMNAIQTAGDPSFALHTGDFVETAEVEDEWKDLYEQSRPSFMSLPVVAAAGNHDEYALNEEDEKLLTKFNEHVNVPKENDEVNGGSYYSFDYNGAHMVVANTNDNKKSKDNPDEKAI